MCDIGWYVISTGISVTDLLIKAIVGEIMVNSTAEASGFFLHACGLAEIQAKRPWNPI